MNQNGLLKHDVRARTASGKKSLLYAIQPMGHRRQWTPHEKSLKGTSITYLQPMNWKKWQQNAEGFHTINGVPTSRWK